MNTFVLIVIIGISLSMDAFSLSLVYGTYGISTSDKILLSIIVGVYHFIMPILGNYLGNYIMDYFIFKSNIFIAIVFLIIGIDMIISSVKNKEDKLLYNIWGFLIFGLSVSIDSFTTGIGMGAISSNYFMISMVFMICSGILTFIGLVFGNKFSDRYGNYSTIMGGIILIVLSIYYMVI